MPQNTEAATDWAQVVVSDVACAGTHAGNPLQNRYKSTCARSKIDDITPLLEQTHKITHIYVQQAGILTKINAWR